MPFKSAANRSGAKTARRRYRPTDNVALRRINAVCFSAVYLRISAGSYGHKYANASECSVRLGAGEGALAMLPREEFQGKI